MHTKKTFSVNSKRFSHAMISFFCGLQNIKSFYSLYLDVSKEFVISRAIGLSNCAVFLTKMCVLIFTTLKQAKNRISGSEKNYDFL